MLFLQVHVFDLFQNKHEALCEQKIVKRAKLTHICFNRADPIIIAGDDHGQVHSLKLSPNLRKVFKHYICFQIIRDSDSAIERSNLGSPCRILIPLKKMKFQIHHKISAVLQYDPYFVIKRENLCFNSLFTIRELGSGATW